MWFWGRLLRVAWTPRRSNQSILKEISPGCSLGGLMLKLKLQYFGHLMRRTDSLGKTLMLGKTEGRRRRERQRMRWLDGITNSIDLSLRSWWWTRKLACCSPWRHRVRLDWATELTDSGLILNTQLLYSFCLQNIYSFAKKYLKVNTHLCSIFNFMQIFPPKLWMY